RGAWEVSGGELRTDGNNVRNGWLLTEADYGDFELRLEYVAFGRANSGVALRTPPEGDPAVQGMEVQLLDDSSYPNLRPTQDTGAIFNVVPRARPAARPAGEWNQLRITVQGRQVTVVLNGSQVLDADLDEYRAYAD